MARFTHKYLWQGSHTNTVLKVRHSYLMDASQKSSKTEHPPLKVQFLHTRMEPRSAVITEASGSGGLYQKTNIHWFSRYPNVATASYQISSSLESETKPWLLLTDVLWTVVGLMGRWLLWHKERGGHVCDSVWEREAKGGFKSTLELSWYNKTSWLSLTRVRQIRPQTEM